MTNNWLSDTISDMDSTYINTVNSLLNALGRDVIVNSSTEVDCPNCSFDNVTQTSTGIYSPDDPYPENIPGPIPFTGVCPVCKGRGKYKTTTTSSIKCLIRWLSPRDRYYISAGMIEPFDVELKTTYDNWDILNNADNIKVDGVDTKIINMRRDGFKTVNSILVQCWKK